MKIAEQDQTPNKLDVALGLRIRQRRKSLGVSQSALADAVGLTFQQIQKYERGFNRVSFSRLVDIAHGLGCRVIDLIGDIDDAGIARPLFRQDTAHLREPGAPELLTAYAAAPPPLRRIILKLALEIAKDQKARHAPTADDGEG
jgi:transcriptional regulator with XRE-family HTH domain